MSNKPILIVAGEPNSIFVEILIKSLNLKFKRPLVLIGSKNLFIKENKKLKYILNFNII